MSTIETEREYLVHAHYCDAEFYMGWWLYYDQIVGGVARYSKRFPDDGGSLWLHGDRPPGVAALIETASRLGAELPAWDRYNQATAEAFAAAFPHGVRVTGKSVHDLRWDTAVVVETAGLKDGWPYGETHDVAEGCAK